MDNLKIKLLFESSPWLLALCLIVGALYSYILYKKKASWGNFANIALAILRGLFVSLLCLLLLNFFIKKTENNVQKNVIGILIDNSKSINNIGQNNLIGLKMALSNLKNNLIAKNFEIAIQSFDSTKEIDSLKFDKNSTNLSKLITDFKTQNEGKNITDLILVSDGINNQGVNLSNLKFTFPIHSLALGDTIPKKDIILSNVVANNIAYLGNDIIVQTEIKSIEFAGKNAQISIIQDGKTLQSKPITLKNKIEPTAVDFKIAPNKKGINKFKILISPHAEEFNLKNNSREIFIDVLDGKQKILILAAAPHPDLKALKNIIENNENFKVTVAFPNQLQKIDFDQKYDLLILHQLPDELGTYKNEIALYKKLNTPLFYIIGNLTSIAAINLESNDLEIGASSYETDKVNGQLNENFETLDLNENALKIIEKLPPILVPFGEFKTKDEIILYQKIGDTASKKPLLVLKNKAPKVAYLLGEGLWSWRMEEYSLTEKNEIVDDLFSKIIQLLAIKEDTRKLRIYPINKEFDLGQSVIFETEVYNDIYQKIFNHKIKLQLTDEKNLVRKYEYSNIDGNSNFQITGLPQGIYKYIGTTEIGGKTENATGEFIIRNIDFEMENLQADFDEMRKISKNTGGFFYKINQIGNLEKDISHKTYIDKIVSEDSLDELITWPWILFTILLLATLEWIARKYLGGY